MSENRQSLDTAVVHAGERRMNGAVTFGGSSLGRLREELIAASTSALNDCFY